MAEIVQGLDEADPSDTGYFYSSLCSLVAIYLDTKGVEGSFRDDIIQDAASYLVMEAKIQHLPRKSHFFWWYYLSPVVFRLKEDLYTTPEELKLHIIQLSPDSYDPFTLDKSPRDFIKVKTKKLESLLRQGKVFDYIDLLKTEFPVESRALKHSTDAYIRNGNTKVLLQAYTHLFKQRNREFKSCQTNIRRNYHRDPPSQRTYS